MVKPDAGWRAPVDAPWGASGCRVEGPKLQPGCDLRTDLSQNGLDMDFHRRFRNIDLACNRLVRGALGRRN
jgi:hypothetical protein